MLIPSIDLQGGSVVQLVQGEKLAIKADDAEPWIQKFSRFPRVQLIDLDAAMGKGDNLAIVRQIAQAHGGTLTVSSGADTTEFRLVLPLAEASAA